MFLYVLDVETSQWIEADELYPHDLALLINNEEKIVYHWSGRQVKDQDREIGVTLATELMERYSTFKLVILDENVTPLQVQGEIEDLLGDNVDPEKYKLKRTIPMSIFVYLGLTGMLALLTTTIIQFTIIGWSKTAYFEVAESDFIRLFMITRILYIITAAIFGAQLILAIISQKSFLVASSFFNIVVALTALLYVAEGISLFEFTPDSLATGLYQIDRFDVIFHLFWIIMFLIVGAVPSVLSLRSILRLTEKKLKEIIDVEHLRAQAKPTILRDSASDLKEIEPPHKK